MKKLAIGEKLPWNIFQQNIIFNWTQKLPPNSCFLLLCWWWKRGRQSSLWGKNYLDLAKRKICFQQNLKELSCTWISSKRMAHGPNSVQCKWSLAIFKALATTEVSVDPSSLLSFLFFHAFSSQLKDYHGWFRIGEGKVQLTAFWQWPPSLQEMKNNEARGGAEPLPSPWVFTTDMKACGLHSAFWVWVQHADLSKTWKHEDLVLRLSLPSGSIRISILCG